MTTKISDAVQADQSLSDIRSNCRGLPPLDAHVEPWMAELLRSPQLHQHIQRHNSPLNVVATAPFARNVKNYRQVAESRGLDFEVYFARKSNKCLSLVQQAKEIDCGIDIASLQELEQVLEAGFDADKVICTAAIKTESLVELCVGHGVVMAVDNLDELKRIIGVASALKQNAMIAIRVSGFWYNGEKLFSRFGFDIDQAIKLVDEHFDSSFIKLIGVHFHLDGYCRWQRQSAISQCLTFMDDLRSREHQIRFLDIGGGIPMNYLLSEDQWTNFWAQLELSLLEKQPPITYRNHGLGLMATPAGVVGRPNSYPYYAADQELIAVDETHGVTHQMRWLEAVLDSNFIQSRGQHAEGASTDADRTTLAQEIINRDLQLRCEPGRSLLDGCGMTIARVEFCKQHHAGHWLIGLSMNHTQCRTSSADFLVDPIVVHRAGERSVNQKGSMRGYLVGAYCMESELICKRLLEFESGIAVGDLVAFANTAGYLMHFLESRSHQFPLASNLAIDSQGNLSQDAID